MKQFENKNGNFMVSKDVEIDTDDLIETEKKPTTQNNNNDDDDFVSKSTCLIHLYFSEEKKISGTLESYKKHCKSALLRGWGAAPQSWEAREIMLWVGYDMLVYYIKESDKERFKKITIEHIAGHEQKIIEDDRFQFGDFEIIEINGPLFKIKLELLRII